MTTTDPFGPTLEAADPISGGTITLRTDRSLDEMDAVLVLGGTDERGDPMFGPIFAAELTGHEAEILADRLERSIDCYESDDPGVIEEWRIIAARLRRLITHTKEASR